MINPMKLTGRNIMVTGSGQGIGKATADMLYRLGANLTLVDSNEAALEEAMKTYSRKRVIELLGSVTDRNFLETAVRTSADHFGGVHGLVNNAGITRTAMIRKMTREDWQAVIDVNLTGAFNCLQIVGREMITRAEAGDTSPGAVVNISSDAGIKGTIGQINYSAAKSGVLGLTMSAAREWGRYGIRVNSVAYGVVETQMTEIVRSGKLREKYLANIPLGRFLKVEEAPNAICFLLSPAATFITGQHLSVNGGSHITA
jgi:3-oxoacyl-[acyl-carrier protein] reductase